MWHLALNGSCDEFALTSLFSAICPVLHLQEFSTARVVAGGDVRGMRKASLSTIRELIAIVRPQKAYQAARNSEPGCLVPRHRCANPND